MKSADNFDRREVCTACHCDQITELYVAKYYESPIKEYIQEFYSRQGGVEFEYLEDAEYVIDECRKCGLVFQEYIPNSSLMARLYEVWIDPEKVFNSIDKNHPVAYYSELAREIESCISYFECLPRDLEFLDFGMGWGQWCKMAQAFGCSVVGAELSEVRIQFAKKFGISTVSWAAIPNYGFDLINTEQVFEHISEPLETLRHLKKALKPNGLLKISVPNGWDVHRRLSVLDWSAPKGTKNSLNLIAPLEHINCFSERSIIEMAKKAGLSRVRVPLVPANSNKGVKDRLKDVVRPIYYGIIEQFSRTKRGSTYLFFRRNQNGL